MHTLSGDETLSRLDSRSEGLNQEEAARRLQEYGPNRLPEEKPPHPLVRFARQFHNVLIYVLLAAAVITALMGHWLDTSVIAGVAVLNALIGFIQEGKAESALAAIRKMLSVSAVVVRDGEKLQIPAEDLVPGDIVLLASGDRVPADLRLLESRNLLIDESSLTGESHPATKDTAADEPGTPLADRSGMAFSGTLVASGRGQGVVTATGTETELGKVNRMVSEVEKTTTPLLQQIGRFGRLLTVFILAATAAVFLFGVLARGLGAEETFLIVVAVAVAAIPEGLPAIISVTLALGVQRMAKRKAIIRRLPAVETLGSVTVICSDKTGTLTLNEMSVREVIVKEGEAEVSGQGYRPEGEITLGGRKFDGERDPALAKILECAALCNDGRMRESEDGWRIEGGPTEGALLVLAAKGGIDLERLREEKPRLDLVPFESGNKYMATLNREGEETVIWMKGAPERVLARCRSQISGEGEEDIDPAFWEGKIEEAAGRGRRVLALAMKKTGGKKEMLEEGDLEGMVFLGLAGIVDPPRPETKAAVAECLSAGITVKMITGDHAATALAIAKEIGIEGEEAITGSELEKLSDEDLARRVGEVNVFARVSPEDKLRLVRALRARGQVTAMTGDGVNDAPALKRADAGIAMGRKGSEAAKEAAELVLADDNFASIVAAVREGRTVYDNIKKVISWTLPTNAGEAMTIIVALLFGLTLPVTPVQILWVNLITAVTLGIALAFEPTEDDTMRRPPRPRNEALLTGGLAWHIVLVSLLFLGGVFGIYAYAIDRGYSIELARTMAVNTLVVMEIFHLFFIRNIYGTSLTWKAVRATPIIWATVITVTIAQFAITYLPPLQRIFATESVPLFDGVLIVAIGVTLFAIIEIEKQLRLSMKGLAFRRPVNKR